MQNLIRKNILKLSPYIPGKPIDEVKRELGLKQVIKLASNENPLGSSARAVRAIKKALSQINRYPDGNSFYLKKALAAQLGIAAQNLIIGNGSDELIDIIIKTFVGDKEEILTADTTFLEYKIVSCVNDRKVVTVPLKNFRYDLAGMAKKINKRTKVVFIANPNNPTGTYVDRFEVAEFLKRIPKNVIVVFDEAYELFVDAKDFPQTLGRIDQNNIIILKTFSKAFGLAGLRVGYAVARPELVRYMEKARQPFNVNYLAQVAAAAAVSDKKFLEDTRRTVLKGKQYLYAALEKLGINYVPSVANFILIEVACEGTYIFKEMLKYGVIVRDMKEYGLNNFIRVTIATMRENRKFISVLRKVMNK
ncbi:MAG: histidinol-phosphate transaminase [Candidatus Omnitrophica bacterium]|nr:histidinol-phosphate transaminase [Candidatus Omnitrophota bacterium]MDD5237261.1 histidinol-phosphate transaminase [Candidatus Omnitrophota bacterium]MDD5610969.1 histidinol-phosphate transaminase [Candidatus Omnitrophota bacterium]